MYMYAQCLHSVTYAVSTCTMYVYTTVVPFEKKVFSGVIITGGVYTYSAPDP